MPFHIVLCWGLTWARWTQLGKGKAGSAGAPGGAEKPCLRAGAPSNPWSHQRLPLRARIFRHTRRQEGLCPHSLHDRAQLSPQVDPRGSEPTAPHRRAVLRIIQNVSFR